MLMYGICVDHIEGINWQNAIDMLKEFDVDLYSSFLDDLGTDYKDVDIEEWFSNYDNCGGYYGIGAFLYDVIKAKESVDLDIDEPNGKVYLGISANVPWNFAESVKTFSKSDFHNVVNKYIGVLTTEPVEIQWWSISDETNW